MPNKPQRTIRPFNTNWRHKAACDGDTDPAWLDDYITDRIAAICRACPVRIQCLNEAIETEAGAVKSGRGTIRGGLEPAERHAKAKRLPIPPRVYGRDVHDVIKASELTIQEASMWCGISVEDLKRALNHPDTRLKGDLWASSLDKIASVIPGADHAPGNTQKGNHNA